MSESEMKHYLLNYDFDNPHAIDWKLFEGAVNTMSERKKFETPIFDILENNRLDIKQPLPPSDLIIIEGRIYWNNENIKRKCDVKIFLETDYDLMLSRRVYKGIACGRDLEQIIQKYLEYVKPNYEKWIESTKEDADFVVQNFGGLIFDVNSFE